MVVAAAGEMALGELVPNGGKQHFFTGEKLKKKFRFKLPVDGVKNMQDIRNYFKYVMIYLLYPCKKELCNLVG